jgi:hypothetical protein
MNTQLMAETPFEAISVLSSPHAKELADTVRERAKAGAGDQAERLVGLVSYGTSSKSY